MEFLPVEIITHVLRFVGVSDRKEAALVCRKWYEASLDPILQRDTIVRFHAPATTGEVFNQLGRRKTPHLVLDQIDGSFSSKTFLLNSCSHLTENLESISLKGSNITETLFTDLMAKCVSLKSIDIGFCNSLFMTGQILAKDEDQQRVRRSLANVKDLNLSSIRYLSDVTFKRILYVCPNVEALNLSGNKITFHSSNYFVRGSTTSSSVLTFTTIVDCLEQRSTKIKSLDFSRTTIDDDALSALASITGLQLQALNLVCCRELTSVGIAALTKTQNGIETLDVSQCTELGDGALTSICEHLHHLRNLFCNKCSLISDSSVVNLYMLDNLERLEIASNYIITARAFSKGLCKGKITKLGRLNLSCCTLILRDSFVVSLCKTMHSSLVNLDLSSSKITDTGLQYICTSLVSVKVLILKWNVAISDDGLLAIPLNVDVEHQIKHELDGSCKCTRKTMGENILNLPKIQPPKPEGATNNELGVPNPLPITNLRSLEILDLSCCPKISDVSVKEFVFPNLKVLHLESDPGVTDEALQAIAKNLPCLEELYVSQCGKITDAGLSPVVRKLRRLRALSLANCDQVTDRFLRALQTYGTRIKHLDVSMCSNVTLEMVETLENNMRHLESVNKRLVGSNI